MLIVVIYAFILIVIVKRYIVILYNRNMVRDKGNNLLELIDDYCVVDLETTGLSLKLCEIIEICILKVRNGKIIDKYETLLKPENEIDDFIENLTGITNEMLKNAPKFSEIYKEILTFIDKDVIVGHNVNFDINFLYDNFIKYNHTFNNNYIDTLI